VTADAARYQTLCPKLVAGLGTKEVAKAEAVLTAVAVVDIYITGVYIN
jgi:hypothetical protein